MKKIFILCSTFFMIFAMYSCLNRNSNAERAENTQVGVHKQIRESMEKEERLKGEGVRKITDSTKKKLDSLRMDSIPRK